jgi:hypothetical protein
VVVNWQTYGILVRRVVEVRWPSNAHGSAGKPPKNCRTTKSFGVNAREGCEPVCIRLFRTIMCATMRAIIDGEAVKRSSGRARMLGLSWSRTARVLEQLCLSDQLIPTEAVTFG